MVLTNKVSLLGVLRVEELPDREKGGISEETLVANHVSPIFRAFAHDPALEIFAHL
jgi:hypothetical protein